MTSSAGKKPQVAPYSGAMLAIAAEDPRKRGQAGFRLDGGDADGDNWMLKGDAFLSRESLIDRDGAKLEREEQSEHDRKLTSEGTHRVEWRARLKLSIFRPCRPLF